MALDALKQENSLLKIRLARGVQANIPGALLEHAEQLQLQLLQKDQAIALLKHDIVEQRDSLHKLESADRYTAFELKHYLLREDVRRMQTELAKMKDTFSSLFP